MTRGSLSSTTPWQQSCVLPWFPQGSPQKPTTFGMSPQSPSHGAPPPPCRSSLLLVEQSWRRLVAGLGHDLHGLVVQGGFAHLVVHEFVLAEHAQFHLRLHPHGLWDEDTSKPVMTKPQDVSVSDLLWPYWKGHPYTLHTHARMYTHTHLLGLECLDSGLHLLGRGSHMNHWESSLWDCSQQRLFLGSARWGPEFEPWLLHWSPI